MPVAPKKSSNASTKSKASTKEEDHVKAYHFHGLSLETYGKEAVGDCPFCGREGKFSVNIETGQWRCFLCGGDTDKGGGGILTFLRLLLEASDKATTTRHYAELAADRGLEFPETVMKWGLAKSILTDEWLIPGYGYDYHGNLELLQLYSYRSIRGRKALMPTPGRKHTLIGLQLLDLRSTEVHVCEGPWDALRWWESIRTTKIDAEGRYVPTASIDTSIGHGVSVVAAATCSAFPTTVGKAFKDRVAVFLYDNDYPVINPKTNEPAPPAGWAGMRRDTIKITDVARDVRYLRWGEGGYDKELPNGYDLRDALKESRTVGLSTILNRIDDAPTEWRVAASAEDGHEVGYKPCDNWQTLQTAWRKAMKWTDGLDHALASMLATISSTMSLGDQLWMKIIGPASCGKSTLCEAVSVNKKYVIAKSTIRGFHSGFSTGAGKKEDNGLIPQIKSKTLVTKDGDTLLQSPNLSQILSEARDLYDSVSRTHYRNQMSKDYENIRMTWLLCGTSSLRQIDASELGERFLDCVIMHKIDEDIEEDILWRTANHTEAQVGIEADERASSNHSPDRLEAMELTGGYIDYLRENASKEMTAIEFSDWAKMQCVNIGKFTAFMRARPSVRQQENAERELAARLVSQYVRYAKCLAFVLNRATVDDEVIRRTRQVGLDTSRGMVLSATTLLYKVGTAGQEVRSISLRINQPDTEVRKLMRFLQDIGVVELNKQKKYQLTQRMRKLYQSVMNPISRKAYETQQD